MVWKTNTVMLVYALKSEHKKRIYVGMTNNIERRLYEHNAGKVSSTKAFRPWKIIFREECGDNRAYARTREKYWKSGTGKEQLKLIPE